MNPMYHPLFTPYTLNNGVEIKNRLVVAPLTIYDSGENGELTETGRRFWTHRFDGFGLYIMPFTNVHPSGIGFASPNAYDESHLETLREYATIAHKQGAKSIIQLAHAGIRAQASLTKGHAIVGPTGEWYSGARALTSKEVEEMVEHFAYGAELALRAGHDGVEIHGANGWLIQQFFSPLYNHRTDRWGGSLENRLRFPLAIIDAIDAVRKKYKRPDFIIGYRFSPEEPGEKGLTMQDTFALVDALTTKPLQYLHVSLWDFYKHARRGANTSLTRMQLLHERISGRLPLIGVGNLYTADDILTAYQTGFADFIALGKTVMLNPNLVALIKAGREDEIETAFDWQKVDKYRYTPAMLEGTKQGLDFYPPSKNTL